MTIVQLLRVQSLDDAVWAATPDCTMTCAEEPKAYRLNIKLKSKIKDITSTKPRILQKTLKDANWMMR